VASRISTLELFNKAKRHVVASPAKDIIDDLIKDAIVQADRELRQADSLHPLAWDIAYYDGLRTKTYADISAISQASPGVVTASSIDGAVTGHGFASNDIVLIDGIDGMEELNTRLFVVVYIDADTFSLKTVDGLNAVDTSGYAAHSSGGAVYHIGAVLDDTTVLAGNNSEWTIKRLLPSPKFDGFGTKPISEMELGGNQYWISTAADRPWRYRYWQNMTSMDSTAHYLFWYPSANDQYNVSIPYQREVPDIAAWTAATYPFHPPQIHDCLWHGALANLAYVHAKAAMATGEGRDLNFEVMNAQYWMTQWEKDKARVVNFSRDLQGLRGGTGGFSI
jgi:hypothetical protein